MSWYPNSVTHPEGPDWDEDPFPRPRCECGCFMKDKPQRESSFHQDFIPIYSEDGDVIGTKPYGPLVEEWNDIWVCKHCGRTYDTPPNWRE